MIAYAPDSLSLPVLSPAIPASFSHGGSNVTCAPLAAAMIELGIITDADFQPASGLLTDVFADPDEKILAERALSRWWQGLTRQFQLFRWSLHVQQLQLYHHDRESATNPWFIISQIGDIPQLTLARRVGILDAELDGFGQTVLAVLHDALHYLPEAFAPWHVYGLAQFHYWGGESDEEAWIANELEYSDYATREELLAHADIFRREDMFRHMPEWLVAPKRLLSRQEIERAARSTLGKQVVEACDAIWSLVTSPDFQLDPMNVGVHDLQAESVEGCVILRWHEEDATIRVLDDALQEFFNSGEYIEAISAQQVEPVPDMLQRYFSQMEQMVQMARLVERLLLLIGDRVEHAAAPGGHA